MPQDITTTFKQLGIATTLLPALVELGYESPTPIQQQSIPVLLEGNDLLAQAQTGTGKTGAFALSILTRLTLSISQPQALILAPTRELAIQVAETFQSYAKHLPGFHVLPIYGGTDYRSQLKALKRGVHVVVGTPGRVMDHLRRGSLSLASLTTLVLDEADEMLKMGFIGDVEWILQQIPQQHQLALFSATMPSRIRKVADEHLQDPTKIRIATKTVTVEAIKQYYTLISRHHKLEALTRYLEIEDFDAVLIFTRTKNASNELADKLKARGYAVAAINGDMSQDQREQVIKRMKKRSLDVVAATDVAARGLDVERISHVINYDIPYDSESYVHRIGRTGRAGREGKALLLVTPREQHMLTMIERATKQKITAINPPSIAQINIKRQANFTAEIIAALANKALENYRELIVKVKHESQCSELDIAAALAIMAQKDKPLSETQEDPLLTIKKEKYKEEHKERGKGKPRVSKKTKGRKSSRMDEFEEGMTRCRVEVGREQRLQPSDIVGAIANMAGVNRKVIGKIAIYNEYSLVDISTDMVQRVIDATYRCKLKKRQMSIAPVTQQQQRKSKFKGQPEAKFRSRPKFDSKPKKDRGRKSSS